MHFFSQIWEENGGASYSPNVALPGSLGVGVLEQGHRRQEQDYSFCFKFFFLFSSSKTQVHLMVQCVI